MSLSTACGWSLARSLLVAGGAVPICVWLERALACSAPRTRRLAWGGLVLPFLFPTLLSGYAWTGASVRLVNAQVWKALLSEPGAHWISGQSFALDEILLVVLLLLRAVPVGTLLLSCAPGPPYSRAAWHCQMLAIRPGTSAWMRWRLWANYVRYGSGRAIMAAAGLMFIIAFQEFELPSLLGRPAWTVWLFDAQVGGLELSESLRSTVLPVCCLMLIVVPLWRGLTRVRTGAAAVSDLSRTGPGIGGKEIAYMFVAVAVACVIPLSLIGGDMLSGFQTLLTNSLQLRRILSETAVGTILAVVAAGIALGLGRSGRRGMLWSKGLAAFALPGLFGPLVLSLVLLRVLQWPGMHSLYRTAFSLAMGQILYLLPRARLLEALIQAARPQEARHAATLLQPAPEAERRAAARELGWRLGGSAEFWSLGLLSYWAYLELALAYLLGPVAIVSVPVLLYNQMHFGKNATLTAMTCLAVAVPAAWFVSVAALRPLILRWFWR